MKLFFWVYFKTWHQLQIHPEWCKYCVNSSGFIFGPCAFKNSRNYQNHQQVKINLSQSPGNTFSNINPISCRDVDKVIPMCMEIPEGKSVRNLGAEPEHLSCTMTTVCLFDYLFIFVSVWCVTHFSYLGGYLSIVVAFDLHIVLLQDCLRDLIGYFVTGLLRLWIWIFCYRIDCGISYEYFFTGLFTGFDMTILLQDCLRDLI